MEPDIQKLVDHRLIENQAAKHKAATERLAAARVATAAAMKGKALAQAATDDAIAGNTDACPHAASALLDTATARLNVANKVQDGCLAAQAKTAAGMVIATGLAFGPVTIAGIFRRIEAAKKFDRATALMAEAEADHVAGTNLITVAFQNGSPRPGEVHNRPRVLSSEAAERKLWADAGIDLESGRHPWDPGAY